jgi:hypothetical protein
MAKGGSPEDAEPGYTGGGGPSMKQINERNNRHDTVHYGITATAAAVGFAVGGPFGAIVGGFIGLCVGGYIADTTVK